MLYPLNKYLVVSPEEVEVGEEQSTVLIPSDVVVETCPYKLVNLVQAHVDSRLKPGMKLLVPSHMLEEISVLGEVHHVVPESCVVGFYGAAE